MSESFAVILASVISIVGLLGVTAIGYRQSRTISRDQHQSWIDQQWWSRKADAYSDTHERIWVLYESAAKDLAQYDHQTGGLPAREESRELYRAAFQKLRQAADSGQIAFSKKASFLVSEYITGFEDSIEYDSTYDIIEHNEAALKTLLEEFRLAALTDLGVSDLGIANRDRPFLFGVKAGQR
ncbi:MAG: hypothetical protein QM753_16650 [Thermomicrobiales bacterium]